MNSSEILDLPRKSRNPFNMRQVASAAGVSIATVSKLLNGKNDRIKVSESTRLQVLDVCKKMGYEPNIHAQRMFSKRSMSLAVVFPPISEQLSDDHNPDLTLAGIIQGTTAAATDLKYHVTLLPADKEFFEEKLYLKAYRNCSVDAFLIWGVRIQGDYLEELSANKIPFMQVQSKTFDSERNQYSFVVCDDILGSRRMVELLLQKGRKKISYVRGFQSSSVGIDRWVGYSSVMREHGLFDQKLVVDGNYTFKVGREAAESLLEVEPQLDAICCANDLMALGVIDYLEMNGRCVPDDISVTGADLRTCYGRPILSSFGASVYDMGYLATQELVKNVISGKIVQRIIAPEIREGTTI